jgi:heme-degrading monooxygenase HmoA
MMTVVTYVTLTEGGAPEWDAAMRERLDVAKGQAGWVRGQLLMPLDNLSKRVIVGTWQTRADWEAWHRDEAFVETRRRLDDLEAGPSETAWFEILAEQAPPSLSDHVRSLARRVAEKAKRRRPATMADPGAPQSSDETK